MHLIMAAWHGSIVSTTLSASVALEETCQIDVEDKHERVISGPSMRLFYPMLKRRYAREMCLQASKDLGSQLHVGNIVGLACSIGIYKRS